MEYQPHWCSNPIWTISESRITTTLGGEKCLQALDGSLYTPRRYPKLTDLCLAVKFYLPTNILYQQDNSQSIRKSIIDWSDPNPAFIWLSARFRVGSSIKESVIYPGTLAPKNKDLCGDHSLAIDRDTSFSISELADDRTWSISRMIKWLESSIRHKDGLQGKELTLREGLRRPKLNWLTYPPFFFGRVVFERV